MKCIRIAEQRKLLGLSQEELATKLNISQKSISKYENGDRRPSYEVLIAMADMFGVSTDYLLGRDESAQKNKKENNFFFFFFDNSLKNVFKLRLKNSLEDKSMNVKDFSEISDINLKKCEDYLEGLIEPSLEDLIQISHTLEVSTDYLLGLSPKLSYYENKVLNSFVKLNLDNKDIIIGKTKDLLREQELIESVAADEEMKQAK